MKKLKEWYQKEGWIQFMLGNQWNCADYRQWGRDILIATWLIIVTLVYVAVKEWS